MLELTVDAVTVAVRGVTIITLFFIKNNIVKNLEIYSAEIHPSLACNLKNLYKLICMCMHMVYQKRLQKTIV